MNRGVRDWWQLRAARERVLLAIGAVVVIVAFGGMMIVVPMQATVASAAQLHAAHVAQRADVDAQVAAIRAAPTAPAPRADSRDAVERALRERGLLANGATVNARDGRVDVLLPAVAMPDLVAALSQLERTDGLRVATAELTPLVAGGVRADLSLTR
ncbi:MAG: type II secretion system protein M [Proteobacteria bacterium]|nr:type II secretion system protein M [Pseudomonadota bacterium]